MGLETALGSLLAAFGLSGAAGLNAWLPLLESALLARLDVVDHALHLLGTIVAPVSGALLFTGQTGLETDLPTVVAVVLGALTAGSTHLVRSTVRPVSTAATGGLGNPIL